MGVEGAADSREAGREADADGISGSCAPVGAATRVCVRPQCPGRIEEESKSFGWKMRAKIGDRKRWYELPEEVEGGP
jgi:hypothetical protein